MCVSLLATIRYTVYIWRILQGGVCAGGTPPCRNKTIARDRPLANSDPRSAIELGLLSVGQERCTNFIMESDRIVSKYFAPLPSLSPLAASPRVRGSSDAAP
jgi:hypothetical protein